ncbi:MAG: hypothetical protein WCZ17_02240 [Candidatus Kapaibacterium sp.]
MNKFYKITIIAVTALIITFTWQSCNVVKDITNTLADIGKLTFKIQNVSNMTVSGIRIYDKKSINDVSAGDILKLTSSFAQKKFPAEFTLNLQANNPNDGSGKTKRTNAIIQSLDYRLILDDVTTIAGDIGNEIVVPGSGQATNIPLNMGLDLFQFFGNRGYESIVNLAMAIGGVSGTPAKVKLDIRPTVKTSIGPMSYPGRITVVSHEWK